MARTQLPLTALASNAGLNEVAGTTIDQANGMYVDFAGVKSGKTVLVVNNTNGTIRNVIIRAGTANPPGFRSGLGDLTFACQASGRCTFGLLESARFVGNTGALTQMYIDFGASIAGTIWAYQLDFLV